MPKKTKKEKLLAEAHRQPAIRRQSSISVQHNPSPSPITTSQITYAAPRVETAVKSTALQIEHTAIRHDLIKTIVFSAAIIVVELLLTRYLR